jgi:hypothetical protein
MDNHFIGVVDGIGDFVLANFACIFIIDTMLNVKQLLKDSHNWD